MPTTIAEAYRRSVKPRDIFWNKYVARPLAAVMLPALERTRITPNQVTLLSLVVFVASVAVLVLVPGHTGLLVSIAILELSYVLDCTDGQLARLRGTSTPIGAHLDFLMDELKAFMLVAATGTRLWLAEDDARWLVEGLLALVAVASAISLTQFIRRPEYAAATGVAPPPSAGDYGEGFAKASAPARRSLASRALGLVEAAGKLVVHYPSYLVYVALFDRLDLFLHAYLFINAAYVGRSLLAITAKLGRFTR